jgi:hypothetical protein
MVYKVVNFFHSASKITPIRLRLAQKPGLNLEGHFSQPVAGHVGLVARCADNSNPLRFAVGGVKRTCAHPEEVLPVDSYFDNRDGEYGGI